MSRIGREKFVSLADAARAGADHLAIFVEHGTALDPAHRRRRDIDGRRRIDDGRRGVGERPAGDGPKRKPPNARRNGGAGGIRRAPAQPAPGLRRREPKPPKASR